MVSTRTDKIKNIIKKREELKNKKRKDETSESDNGSSSESDHSDCDEEMSATEIRKYISKIYPSKHMDKKIKSDEKMKKYKKLLKEIENDEDDDYVSKKSHKKRINKNKNIIVSSDEDSENNDEEEWSTEDEKPKKSKKNSKSKHLSKKKQNKKSKDDSDNDDISLGSSSDSSDEDDEYEPSEDYSQSSDDKKDNQINMVFTIGFDDNDEDEWDDEDEEWEDESADTEDEDEPVSESEDEDEDEESICDTETCTSEEESVKHKKGKKGTKIEKSKKIEQKQITDLQLAPQKSDEEVLKQLKELYENDKNNKTLRECIKVCEEKIKKNVAKKERYNKKTKAKHGRIFRKIMKDKNTMNDSNYFDTLEADHQKRLIKELREVNKTIRVEKPYRISILESQIPAIFKGTAIKKINSMKHMEPGGGEYYKIKNWIDTFMHIPFNKFETLPVNIDDGVEKCHEFMENAQKTLDEAVYGLNDAKMQIMQMLGQLVTNPKSVGTAIAIQGPMGTGKTTLVKEGISKILRRPFAFIALGGATDSSFLEGHSYTYEGSTWGKIVQILIDSKCMNPVIYFDELDKISDTPKGEEIVGILTHLTDTSQNSQFHDKYFAEIDFDLSKCLFIFSYNDESRVNPILRDRMYRIQTKGYDRKQKTMISNNYLLPRIREQVKFTEEQLNIPEETIHYLIENFCNKEDGVRNLKRCLEIIYTKLNLYRLMRPDTNLFEQDMSIKVEFPFIVTKQIVDKLIKKEDNFIRRSMEAMYI
jgi:ATP-dependent Lon protease